VVLALAWFEGGKQAVRLRTAICRSRSTLSRQGGDVTVDWSYWGWPTRHSAGFAA